MSEPRRVGSFWPPPHQELLLVAGLGDRPAALSAWERLRPGFDLQAIDDGTFAVLPLVYRMLDEAGVGDPLVPRLKGIYRNTWVRNSLLVDRLRETARVLASAPSPPVLVGSIGSAIRYYPALGLRPTPCVELLVDEAGVLDTVLALGRAGWTARGAPRATPAEPLALVDRGGNVCLLRVALAPDFASPAADGATAWAETTTIDVGGAMAVALGPTDDLLAAVVTGARAGGLPALQWIVDAVTVMRTAPDRIDWQRLVRVGVANGQGLRLRHAFAYLRRLLGVGPPEEVEQALAGLRPTRRERLVYGCTVRSVRGLGSMPQALAEHLVQTASLSPAATIATLPGFLQRRWQLEHPRQLLLAGLKRAGRSLAQGYVPGAKARSSAP